MATRPPVTVVERSSAHDKRTKRGKWRWRQSLTPYLFIMPAWLLILFVLVVPLGWIVYISLHSYNFGRTETTFVGFDNFIYLLYDDDQFWSSARLTLMFTIVGVAFEYTIALALALLLNQCMRGKSLYRVALLMPWCIPGVIASVAWIAMYNPELGALDRILQGVGLTDAPVGWLTDSGVAFWSVVIVAVWKTVPFMMIALLAARQGIPVELYEAARMDGARAYQMLRHITLPLLRPVTYVVLILGTIWGAKSFDEAWVLTNGGPGNATNFLSVDAYQRLAYSGEVSMSGAEGVLLAMPLLVIIAVAVPRFLRRES